jgi:Ca2+-binding EF-hand superfamily protein
VLRRRDLEFRVFVEAAERQLLLLFRAIDRDQDGRLNKKELQSAFRSAGLSVPGRRLAGFFDEIDLNHDGFITFDEWRYVCPVCFFPFLLCHFAEAQSVTHLKVDFALFYFVYFDFFALEHFGCLHVFMFATSFLLRLFELERLFSWRHMVDCVSDANS